MEKQVYTVSDIISILGISKTTAYQLVRTNCFKSVRIGNSIRIPKKSFDEWLDNKSEKEKLTYGNNC
ncbi:MAG: helix-turn-helix domain-containing protein [Coprobacillaceae bacterium]